MGAGSQTHVVTLSWQTLYLGARSRLSSPHISDLWNPIYPILSQCGWVGGATSKREAQVIQLFPPYSTPEGRLTSSLLAPSPEVKAQPLASGFFPPAGSAPLHPGALQGSEAVGYKTEFARGLGCRFYWPGHLLGQETSFDLFARTPLLWPRVGEAPHRGPS